MVGGFDSMAMTGGFLSGINQQISNNRNEQTKQDDYASQLAAKSTQAAKDADAQDQRDAQKLNDQSEALGRLANGGADPTPGHIMAAHTYLRATGADLSKVAPDELDDITEKLKPVAANINAKLQAKQNAKFGIDPVNGSTLDQRTQAALQPAVPNADPASSVALDASSLQNPDASGLPATTINDSTRTNVMANSHAGQGMFPANTNSNYNEDFMTQLSQENPTRANMAKQAVMGTLDPKVVGTRAFFDNKGHPTQLYKDAIQYDPNFNTESLVARQQLVKEYVDKTTPSSMGARIQSLNQLSLHMKELTDSAVILNNHDNILGQTGSAIANSAESHYNDPRLGNFNTVKSACADEVSKLFRAGVISDAEKKSWDDNLKSSATPAALVGTPDKPGAIMTMARLVRDSADTINDKWNTQFNQNVDWMTPRSRDALQYTLSGGKSLQELQQHGNTPANAPQVPNAGSAPQGQPPQQNGQQPQPQQGGSAQPQQNQPKQQDLDAAKPGTTMIINGVPMRKKAPAAPAQGQQQAAQ